MSFFFIDNVYKSFEISVSISKTLQVFYYKWKCECVLYQSIIITFDSGTSRITAIQMNSDVRNEHIVYNLFQTVKHLYFLWKFKYFALIYFLVYSNSLHTTRFSKYVVFYRQTLKTNDHVADKSIQPIGPIMESVQNYVEEVWTIIG